MKSEYLTCMSAPSRPHRHLATCHAPPLDRLLPDQRHSPFMPVPCLHALGCPHRKAAAATPATPSQPTTPVSTAPLSVTLEAAPPTLLVTLLKAEPTPPPLEMEPVVDAEIEFVPLPVLMLPVIKPEPLLIDVVVLPVLEVAEPYNHINSRAQKRGSSDSTYRQTHLGTSSRGEAGDGIACDLVEKSSSANAFSL